MSLSSLYSIAGGGVLLPYYHMISDEQVPHVRHLYRYKTTKEFERDLDWLLCHFNPISLEDLQEFQEGYRSPPARAFHLSFDDGFAEMEAVASILYRRSVPATFFVCSAFVDNQRLGRDAKASLLAEAFLRSRPQEKGEALRLVRGLLALPPEDEGLLDELQPVLGVEFTTYLRERRPYLDGRELQRLAALGFSIGAHSVDHPRYGQLEYGEQLRQTYESLRFLRDRLGVRLGAFAFPYSDLGVDARFFAETGASGLLDLSFGTGGHGASGRHFQRLSFEKPPVAARRIVRSAALRRIAKHVLRRIQAHLPIPWERGRR